MSEWWTYSLRDLLLFSPQTYYRMFELYNLECWPLQLFTLAAGLAILGLWRRGGSAAGRAMAAILALGWLWVGWAFHGQRYATINLAAEYYAWAFALQAMLLLWLGGIRGGFAQAASSKMQQRAGLGLFLFALLVFPLLAPFMGRGWAQAELFGLAPDPTALATLGVLLFAGVRPYWMLFPIPVIWCVVSGATLWTMESPDFVIPLLAALLAVAGAGAGGLAGASRRDAQA